MSAPRSILKKPSTPYTHAAPSGSKPKLAGGGSKLKQTVAVAGAHKSSRAGAGSSNGGKPSGRSKVKKARIEGGGDEEGEDVDMSENDEDGEDEVDGDEDEEVGTDEEIERSKKGKTKATPSTSVRAYPSARLRLVRLTCANAQWVPMAM